MEFDDASDPSDKDLAGRLTPLVRRDVISLSRETGSDSDN